MPGMKGSGVGKRVALFCVAFLCSISLGVILIAGGDWVPGAVMLVGGFVGLIAQIPVVWKLLREAPAAPPRA